MIYKVVCDRCEKVFSENRVVKFDVGVDNYHLCTRCYDKMHFKDLV